VRLDAPCVATLGARERGNVDVEPRPGAGRAVPLREPVHDRVPAVRQDHEQHAGAVLRRAPERLDPVEGRAVAHDCDDRALRQCHPHAGRARQGEAEPAHRRAEEAERGSGEQPVVELRPVDGRLFDDDCVARETFGERGQDVTGKQRLARRRRVRCRGRPVRVRRCRLPAGNALHEGAADGRGRPDDGDLRWAPVHLVGVVADDRDPGARRGEATLGVGRLAEGRRADDEERVVGREPLAQSWSVGGKDAGEQPVVLGEAGARAEGLLEDRRDQALREVDERIPGVGIVGTGADDDRRRTGALEEPDELVDRARIGGRTPHHQLRGGVLPLLVGRGAPVVHRHRDERRPAVGGRLVCGAGDRTRDVLRAHRLVGPDGVLAREPAESARQERLECQVPPVLLADENDERRAVDAGGGERADRVAQARGRVEQRECRLVACDRPSGRQPDHGALVQGEHEAKVVGKAGEERHLGRAGIAEDRRQAVPAEDVEGRVADGAGAHRASIPECRRSV
jgi:hypothetical protein